MELVLISAVIGAGYMFGKDSKNRFKDITFLSNVPKNEVPSGNNIYDSERSQEIWHSQRRLAKKIFDKSKDGTKTNYMIAGPPVPIFNKIDATGQSLPIEYKENNTTFLGANQLQERSNNIEKALDKKKYTPNIDLKTNDIEIPPGLKDQPASGGWQGISLDGNIKDLKGNNVDIWVNNLQQTSLTGEPIVKENFTHNNMVPFFGGTVKQNVDEYANSALLENFTGNDENYLRKQEVERNDFFKPVANLTNVYGSSNLDGYNYDRYIVSNRRANQAPVEKIRVGPGLNKGYTHLPSGGFQQSDTRDFVLPKTVDELRVKTNPKVSYQNQVIPGKHIAMPGKIGTVAKNNPDTFYLNSPDRLFTTVGASSGPKQRPNVVMKYTNRKTTELKTRIGSAAPAQTGSQQQMRPGVKKSTRQNYPGAGPRNQNAEGAWDINGPNKQIPNDYGRSSMNAKPNMRNSTECKTVVTNVSVPNKLNIAPNNPKLRPTRKTNVVGNNRWSGNFQSTGPKKPVVYDPNDVTRTTIKEQNINNNHKGYFQSTGPQKPTVYDPNDVTRTTIKEQNINNNHKGYFQTTGPRKPTVYDPNDITRTTIKEQNIDNNHQGYFQTTGPRKPTVYDPNDITRTTIKEQNIDNNHQGYFQTTGPQKQRVYDPNDVTRTTIKEQNIDNNRQGNFQSTGPKKPMVYDPNDGLRQTIKQQTMVKNNVGNVNTQKSGGGYINKKVEAKTTNRQQTSVEYIGDAKHENVGGYQISNVKAKNTARQFTSDTEYSGSMGPASEKAPMSYSDIYNATIKSIREDVAKGREPSTQGPKTNIPKDMVNMKTTKNVDNVNNSLEERGIMSTKVYNSIPQPNAFGETHEKDSLPNEPIADRLDPNLLDPFRENPYTQSLHSHAFP